MPVDEPATVGDVMDRGFVGVSEGDPVAGAAALMQGAGVNAAVVLRGEEPVGLLRAGDLVGIVADAADPEAATTAEVMTGDVLTIAPDRPLEAALDRIATADDTRRLVVVEDGEVIGTLSEHDLVTATALRREHMAAPASTMRTAAAPLQDPEYADQGVCEVCGSLSTDLESRNGQLVCPDCRGL
ncbi:MAG: cyclic nucleotide-binding/CBS domain-containing protein [Halobacteriales archaeon]